MTMNTTTPSDFSKESAALHQACRALLTGEQPPATHCRILQRHDADDGLTRLTAVPPARISTSTPGSDITFHNTWILDTCAVVEYKDLMTTTAGYLMALKPTTGWTVICLVYEDMDGSSSSNAQAKITAQDMTGPISACWDRYCGANRACDGTAMARVFHKESRLMFVKDDGTVATFWSAEFCTMAQQRYNREPHKQYAAYKEQTHVTSQHDTLQGCSMISPTLALVRLKVGHPPFLWSDLLICARLSLQSNNNNNNNDEWWIVAKCSDHEEFIPQS